MTVIAWLLVAAGDGRSSELLVQTEEDAADGVSYLAPRAKHPLGQRKQGGKLLTDPALSPATSVVAARPVRAAKVSGCSASSIRSVSGALTVRDVDHKLRIRIPAAFPEALL